MCHKSNANKYGAPAKIYFLCFEEESMTLTGKITLCELEEDNPQKSYFRVRPLLTGENGQSEKVEDVDSLYPDEGGIRIVPDKNEAMRFKSRMRTLGGYCLLNLIRHPNENDKIRPNKNYSPERGEMNRNIVYSDVIQACGPLDVMQVLSAGDSGKSKIGYTHKVLLRERGMLKGPYIPELTPDRMIFGFNADVYNEPIEAKEENIHRFMRGNEEIELYISDSVFSPSAESAPRPFAPGAEAAENRSEAPGETASPAPAAQTPDAQEAESKASAESPAPKTEPEAEKPAAAPQPFARPALRPQAPKPAKPEENKPAARENAPQAENTPEKRPLRKNDPYEGQVGLNPRRSKSLSEVVDYYWRQSRIEQLGAEVSSQSKSSPVVSPVEQALRLVREVWQLPDGRQALISGLTKLDGLGSSISPAAAQGAKTETSNASDDEMNRLEAERLELLRDIDRLKSDRIRQRGELMEETRAAHAKEISELEKREQMLRDECQSRERAAQSARQAQAEAERLLTKESKDKLDSEFLRFAMFTKAAGLIKNEEMLDTDEFTGIPETCEKTAAQMISDLRSAFETGGKVLSHDDALNYLACLAIGSIVLLSGPTGCGKSYTAHALAGALGLRQKGAARFARLEEGVRDARKCIGFRELMRATDYTSQRFMLLEDINQDDVTDQSHGTLPFSDGAKSEGITLLMTCLDDQIGYPLQSRLLDRAFLIRLKMPEYAGWHRSKPIPTADKAPTLECVRRAFLSGDDVPEEIRQRMDTLMKRLREAGVSVTPRALNDIYLYCAAVCPLMTGEKIDALDRAFSQRALPHIMATAKAEALRRLPEILCDMPRSISLLNEPLALPPM